MLGRSPDFRPDRKAEPELAASLGAAQREFFKLLYNLLIGKDTGPRLPTLLLAASEDPTDMALFERQMTELSAERDARAAEAAAAQDVLNTPVEEA